MIDRILSVRQFKERTRLDDYRHKRAQLDIAASVEIIAMRHGLVVEYLDGKPLPILLKWQSS